MLDEGITLMIVGMGTVFVFLTLLVGAMSLMSVLVRRLAAAPAIAETDISAEEVAVIGAALRRHRQRHKSQNHGAS